MRRALLLVSVMLALAACKREDRDYRSSPAAADTGEPTIAMTPLSPGGGPPLAPASAKGASFEQNAYHVSQGKRLFTWFNCNGCHANGGGGSGPALMDAKWIYGGSIENIVATIRQGRPNGMPSFRGRIPDDQIWEIAAYVRSLSGTLSKSVAPSRSDDINPHPSENRLVPTPPISGGTAPPGAQSPQ